MTTMTEGSPLEDQIAQWRQYLRRRRAIHGPDVEELEGHLRDQVATLTGAGLSGDEAFLVAVKRMGNLDELSREFAREHSERLWKQLVVPQEAPGEPSKGARAEPLVVLLLAVAAAVAIKLPALFGIRMAGDEAFYGRNLSLFVLPLLTGYFAWKRKLSAGAGLGLSLCFAAAALFANVYPFGPDSHTEILTALHLPIALWLAVGVAYVGGTWFGSAARMDFVRYSGELLIYYSLIALGGGVFTGFTVLLFEAIGIRAEWLAQGWLIPCGAMGAVLVGSWLVEAKQSVIENMAPVLTRLFTPLFTIMLLAFLGTMAWTGRPIDVKREVLIACDLLLVPVSADYLALQGAQGVDRALDALEPVFKRRLPRRYVLTRFDGRRRMSADVAERMRAMFRPEEICATRIRESVKLAESPSVALDVFRHAPGSNGARDYGELVEELVGAGFLG